jgi:hypothetical protein
LIVLLKIREFNERFESKIRLIAYTSNPQKITISNPSTMLELLIKLGYFRKIIENIRI